ncbi:hypothetical protein QR685DRAFT_601198 [Neurospora intermedia]|uniref:Uncharacterized protein n=1 Tax=Neurospora intermedia TaxID=5142 RepID=A0ABR3CYQ8_NEUIN
MPSTYLSSVDGPHRDSARLLCISTRPLADKAAFGTPSQAEAGLGRILLTSWTTAPGHRDSHVDALGRPQIGDFYGYIGDILQPPRSKDPFYGRLGS